MPRYTCSDHLCELKTQTDESFYKNCTRISRVCDQDTIDEGTVDCVKASDLASNKCLINGDCGTLEKDAPICQGNNVVQTTRWGECQNPNTATSKCVNKQETSTIEACGGKKSCVEGRCIDSSIPSQTTQTTIAATTTSFRYAPATYVTTSSTTTTATTATTATTTTQPAPTLMERLIYESPLELTFDVIGRVLDIIVFWDLNWAAYSIRY